MQHPLDLMTLENSERFIFTPCPGTKEASLENAVANLKTGGANAIVTLMYDNELAKNDAQSLSTVCKENGMDWFQLPISDEDAPSDDFVAALNEHIDAIKAHLAENKAVAFHCKGGSGRTGLGIAIVMLHLGYDREYIVEQVQKMRPKALKHPVQRAYFDRFVV